MILREATAPWTTLEPTSLFSSRLEGSLWNEQDQCLRCIQNISKWCSFYLPKETEKSEINPLGIYEMTEKRKGSILEHNIDRIKVEQLSIKKEFRESICTVGTTSLPKQVEILSDKGNEIHVTLMVTLRSWKLTVARDWTESLPNSYVEVLIPKCNGTWKWGSEEIIRFRWGHEDWVLIMNEISALIRDTRECAGSPLSPRCEDTVRGQPCKSPEESSHQKPTRMPPCLELWASKTMWK